jgi:YfiR/HmsC-like
MKQYLAVILIFVLSLWLQAAHADAAAPVNKLKAIYLYNFTNYITWPVKPPTITLCVKANKEIFDTLDYISQKQHSFQVKKVSSKGDLAECSLVYVGKEESLDGFPKIIAGQPVLSVSDLEGFSENEGAIEFVLDGEKLKLRINKKVLDSSGLAASSKLLDLAADVH